MVEVAQVLAILLLLEIAVLALLHIADRRAFGSRAGRVEFAMQWNRHGITMGLITLGLVLFMAMEVGEILVDFAPDLIGPAIGPLHSAVLLLFIASMVPPLIYHITLIGMKK